jgi:4-carboxymuconolactone decarboxylase
MSDEASLFEKGLAIRREVLGDVYVDRALDSATEFGAPLQNLRTRSLVNIGMLSALNRQPEVVLHVKGALRNGCTLEEIREVILQVAVYCGVPAAIDANRSAEAAILEFAEEPGDD